MQNGLDLAPPPAALPSPAAQRASPAPGAAPSEGSASAPATTSASSGSSASIGVVVGVTLGCAAAVVLAAVLLYFFVVRPRMRGDVVADAATAQDRGAHGTARAILPDHSGSDASSQVGAGRADGGLSWQDMLLDAGDDCTELFVWWPAGICARAVPVLWRVCCHGAVPWFSAGCAARQALTSCGRHSPKQQPATAGCEQTRVPHKALITLIPSHTVLFPIRLMLLGCGWQWPMTTPVIVPQEHPLPEM